MYRSKSYDKMLSEKLQKPRFAQEFLTSLMEGKDGLALDEALKHVIKKMGLKEFSELSGLPASNIAEFLKGKRKPKRETLDLYLRPFHLKSRLVVEKAS